MSKTSLNKVLFISHEASRSGAPIVLLHLLKWLKANTDLKIEILLLNDGPLRTDFEKIGKTLLVHELTKEHSVSGKIQKKVLGKTSDLFLKKVADQFARQNYDLVYGNTILSLPLLKKFKEEHRLKTLCCIHELSFALNYSFSKTYLHDTLPLMDCIIAVSNAVKENLINAYDLSAKKIHLHYEFIDTADEITSTNKPTKQDLGIAHNEFIIGMGGTAEWRKGADLIIPLTLKLIELHSDLYFKMIWLGAGPENNFVKQLQYDAEKCGVSDKLVFLDTKPNPLDFISLFDVFVLLSREDPFPLIALEAAFLEKPIIAFENSGGMPELISQGAGLLAPYLDITEIARQIYKLKDDTSLKDQLGKTAKQLVINSYNTPIVAPVIYDTMNLIIKNQ